MLVLAVGPWPESDKKKAEGFADRFVTYAGSLFPPESAAAIQGLAGRFPAGSMALGEIERTRYTQAPA